MKLAGSKAAGGLSRGGMGATDAGSVGWGLDEAGRMCRRHEAHREGGGEGAPEKPAGQKAPGGLSGGGTGATDAGSVGWVAWRGMPDVQKA